MRAMITASPTFVSKDDLFIRCIATLAAVFFPCLLAMAIFTITTVTYLSITGDGLPGSVAGDRLALILFGAACFAIGGLVTLIWRHPLERRAD